MVRYLTLRAALTFVALATAGLSFAASAEIVFEGYYKINLGETHSGYAVQRYEYQPKKKQCVSVYFIQTNQLLGNLQESVVATANEKFEPIQYQYTTKVGSTFKVIDAKFEKNMIKAAVKSTKSSNNIAQQVPKGTFLSTFLGYVMLQKGYSTDRKYNYKAIAEEDAKVHSGTAFIKAEVTSMGVPAYRILNEFKGSKFVSIVSKTGEVMKTLAPLQRISTELVKSPAEATKGFKLPQKSLNLLFGGIPVGTKNVLHQAQSKPATNLPNKVQTGSTVKPVPANNAPKKKGP